MHGCKALTKQPEFDLEHAKETFMKAKKSFAEAFTSVSKDRTESERDTKVVKGLQELIFRCARSDATRMVRKLGKHALCTGWEMRLTTQNGDYEMHQVILNLGLDVNVLPKQTCKHMGRPTLQ